LQQRNFQNGEGHAANGENEMALNQVFAQEGFDDRCFDKLNREYSKI
jgi:hypothetical protein